MLQSSVWWLFQSLPHVCRYHFYYVVRTYSTYGQRILLSTHVHTYFFMISRTKYTKNVLVGSPAVLIRDEIHCNEYPGTRRVMSVGYPGSKFSTRFNPNVSCMLHGFVYDIYFIVFYRRTPCSAAARINCVRQNQMIENWHNRWAKTSRNVTTLDT